jgi:hypothetical protein
MSDDDPRAVVRELARAVSTQAQVANRLWIVLMTVAFFAVLPLEPTDGKLPLPFGFGKVDAVLFHSIVYSILVVVALAFASAHAQQVRAQRLAQDVVDSLSTTAVRVDEVHLRELFDMWRLPSLNRVAPLAQALRGKYQFYKTRTECPQWLRGVTIVYYVLLKLTALLVFFGLPLWALWHAHASISVSGRIFEVALFGGGVLAGLALLQVALTELIYTKNVLLHLWRGRDSDAAHKSSRAIAGK